MDISNFSTIYILILLVTLGLIQSQQINSIKIMLWLFLIGTTFTFCLVLLDYTLIVSGNIKLFNKLTSTGSIFYITDTALTFYCQNILSFLNYIKFVYMKWLYVVVILVSLSSWINKLSFITTLIVINLLLLIIVIIDFILLTNLMYYMMFLPFFIYSNIKNIINVGFKPNSPININYSDYLIDEQYISTMYHQVINIQYLFILLTLFLLPLALLSNWNEILNKKYFSKVFLNLLLLIGIILIIGFSTFNLFVFIIMFEAVTIPLFLLIGLFGHRSKKHRAAWYLFIYTLIGSIFMLGSVILIYSQYQTVNLFEIFFNSGFKELSPERYKLVWLGLFIGFATKIPIAPFHMWLPEAHVEAPTAGSILLAGILLKLGGYGIIIFMLPFFSFQFFSPLIYTWTFISIFYSSFILFRETHLKKIIAYSSIIHMNIGILGLFSNNVVGISGGIFMMFSHGFISSGLFFSAGIIFNRYKTYDITIIKNLSSSMPLFSFFFLILIFGNMGLPLTSGFIGEFLVLYGLLKYNFFVMFIVLVSLLLNTIYNILLLTRILYGNLLWSSLFQKSLIIKKNIISLNKTRIIGVKPLWKFKVVTTDINRIEFTALLFFTFFTLLLGIYPNLILMGFYLNSLLFII